MLPIVHGLGIDSHLVVKKYQSMEAMLLYLGKWCLGEGDVGWIGTSIYKQGGSWWQQDRAGQVEETGGLPWGGWDMRWGTGVCRLGSVTHAHSGPPLASRVGDTKHGMMKFREDRSLLGLGLPSGGFHDRYFILNSSCLRLYKEVRVSPVMDIGISFVLRHSHASIVLGLQERGPCLRVSAAP